jgi:DNA-binding NarL/FixJ family response regulator
LRGEGRRFEARQPLRSARELFVAIGAEAFAARAGRELAATGEVTHQLTVELSEQITAQELMIARLARDGLSNPEIGSRLFISPRTVEYHLSKVFATLGVRSRRQLERALPKESGFTGAP